MPNENQNFNSLSSGGVFMNKDGSQTFNSESFFMDMLKMYYLQFLEIYGKILLDLITRKNGIVH